MPETLKILIVENEKNDIQAYLDTIKTVNQEQQKNGIVIEPVVKETKDSGLEALADTEWTAAFIDLKLSTGNILKAEEGNEIVKEIYKKRRFPVFILTNTPEDVSKDFKHSVFLTVASKADVDYHEIFSKIIQIHYTGILNILGRKGIIEKMLDEIFWNNISLTLDQWYKVDKSEKPLLRHTISHLLEYLEISESGGFDTYHPQEAYIYPTIKKHAFTGDILRSKADGKNFVILTPACDLAPHGEKLQPKTDRILVAEIESFKDNVLSSIVKKIGKATEEEKFKEQEKLFRLITNNYADQFFYLPESTKYAGGVVNFRKLNTVRLKELYDSYDCLCNLSLQFVKDLIARFSFYYSRQGAPDFDFNAIVRGHVEKPT